jgi:long-chain acyl-CoA synthetase
LIAMPSPPTGEDVLARPFGVVAELIGVQAARRPRHPALRQDERVLDYGALDALMNRVAAALQRDGLAADDVVAICAANSIEYAAVFLGALRAGVVVAPLAPSNTATSIAGMAVDAGARLLFADADAAAKLTSAHALTQTPLVTLDDTGAGQALRSWLAGAGAAPAKVVISPDQPFNIIYSSGTTGTPKGIVQPHSMRWAHVQRAPVYGYDEDCVTLLSTPLYSNTTLVSFFPTVTVGGTVVLMAKFDPVTYLVLAERHRVTHTMLVPVQYRRIMALAEFDGFDLSSFRMKLSTSAPFAADLKADILCRWPGALVEFYGMTEGGGTCVLNANQHPDKLHTVGLPAPGHDIRLIDEHGREVARGGTGEVVGHSGGMMTGYHRQPGETAEAEWFDDSGKRYIRTGDVGRFDADGFLILLDRRKDLIISGGFNVYPSDIESVLRAHRSVAEVAVVGVPSLRWGETPVAFVVRKPDAALAAGELLAWANARVGKLQRLRDVEFVDALPRSTIGKVLKRELRERYGGDAGQD